MSLNQKESVFVAVQELAIEQGFEIVAGTPVSLTKEQRKTVIEMVSQAAIAGDMQMTAEARTKYNTIEKMRGYVNGLVSNWLAKDTRLNGGEKHTIKNPGSRAGQGDAVLRNLKALRSQVTDTTHISSIDEEISKREAEVAANKSKSAAKPIDPSFIPESLRHLLK